MHSTHPFKCSQCKYVYIYKYLFISIVTYIIYIYLLIYIYIYIVICNFDYANIECETFFVLLNRIVEL